MGKETLRRLCARLLTRFLVGMLILTFLSRAFDSVTVPKVKTGYCAQGTVDYEISGEGTLLAREFYLVDVMGGVRIARTDRALGQGIKAGDPLFAYHMSDLQRLRDQLDLELQKLSLNMKKAQLGVAALPGLTEEQLAYQQLDQANRARLAGQADLKNAETEYQEKLKKLAEEYHGDLNRTQDQITDDMKRSYKSASRRYDAAVLSRDKAVQSAKRKVEECRKKLDQLKSQGAGPDEIEEAQYDLEAAEEELEQIRDEENLKVEEAEDEKDNAEDNYDSMIAGDGMSPEQLRKNYEAAVEAEHKRWESIKKDYRTLEEAVLQAEQNLENARIKDQDSKSAYQRNQELSKLEQEILSLDVEEKKRELEETDRLIAEGGQVTAQADGTLVRMELENGKQAAGTERVQISQGSLQMKGKIDKKLGERIKPGMEIQVKALDSRTFWTAEVSYVDTMSEGDFAELTADLPEGAGTAGASVMYELSMRSELYQQVISIDGLREDTEGYYCLVAEPFKTILGEELAARRLNVTLLEKSSKTAAIEGPVTPDSRIILSGNRLFKEGDRIRVDDE